MYDKIESKYVLISFSSSFTEVIETSVCTGAQILGSAGQTSAPPCFWLSPIKEKSKLQREWMWLKVKQTKMLRVLCSELPIVFVLLNLLSCMLLLFFYWKPFCRLALLGQRQGTLYVTSVFILRKQTASQRGRFRNARI